MIYPTVLCMWCLWRLQMDRVKRVWYLSPMRAAKVQVSLRIRAVLPEASLLAHTSSESSRTFRQKARSMAPLNGWACAVKICHDGMLEDANSLDGAQITSILCQTVNSLLSNRPVGAEAGHGGPVVNRIGFNMEEEMIVYDPWQVRPWIYLSKWRFINFLILLDVQ